ERQELYFEIKRPRAKPGAAFLLGERPLLRSDPTLWRPSRIARIIRHGRASAPIPSREGARFVPSTPASIRGGRMKIRFRKGSNHPAAFILSGLFFLSFMYIFNL